MRILVTGGCGFIGSHLTDFLVARGDEVVILDDLSTGKLENAPKGVQVIKGDVTDAALVAKAMEGAGACFHLAAIVSVPLCRELKYRSHYVNQSGLVNVLENSCKEAKRTGKAVPVIYASSAAVYGDNGSSPIAENSRISPISSYGLDKYGCELQSALASSAYGVPTVGLRFFNAYGPRQVADSPYSGVISAFMHKALEKKPLTVYGDGKQQRDFVYVSDIVNAFSAALDAANGEALVANICTGKGTTILELANKIGAISGYLEPIRFTPPREDDIRQSVGDPAFARQKLTFQTQTELEEGLKKTFAYYKTRGR
ncbi:MAG: NAD-dependent epimerase/dehydratase family protein [Bdellovibrionales bacterium]